MGVDGMQDDMYLSDVIQRVKKLGEMELLEWAIRDVELNYEVTGRNVGLFYYDYVRAVKRTFDKAYRDKMLRYEDMRR